MNPEVTLPDGRVVLGTMTFGDSIGESDAASVLDIYLSAGGRHVDTANGYAGGASEEILGSLLRGRDDLFVASKVGIPHPDSEGFPPLSREAILRSIDGSLRRLGRDQIDLYYLHQPDPDTPILETLETLAGLLQEGRIRSWGLSNFASWQLVDLANNASSIGLAAPLASQQMYNAICRKIEDEFVAAAKYAATPIIAYNPLAGGLLTDRHRYENKPQHGRFGEGRLGAMYIERYWDPRIFEAIDRLRTVVGRSGLSMAELSLRWLLSKPQISGLLVGGSQTNHVAENLDMAAKGQLDAELVSAVDAIGNWLAGPVPHYKR
ncbi:aldo/keto reductase [Georgenia halophila]|uniref:Aldo/keto reductase n=1 Tax=Georgenia halophila TaxID=620889 RepID=A0ABP8LF96_9MICO